jgi:addiction module RelE/StbE family toxin
MAKRLGTYRVIWTETAKRDLEDVVYFIAVDSKERATKTLKRIRTKAASLRRTPMRGRVVPELLDLGFKTWRELILSPYRIIYRVEGRSVLVLSVLDGRRNVEAILMDRLMR